MSIPTFEHVDDVLALASIGIAEKLGIRYHRLPASIAPDTLDAATEYFNKHGALGVGNHWHGRRFFGTREAANSFDAWHDHTHVTNSATFDKAGEDIVNSVQQRHLMTWANRWAPRSITRQALQRASAMLDMHNVGRLVHWAQWGGPPGDARSFAEGYMAALGFAAKPSVFVPSYQGNEWNAEDAT